MDGNKDNKEPRDNRDNRHRFNRKNRGHDNNSWKSPRPKHENEAPVFCSLCKQQLFDLSSALADQNGSPVHFDCALTKVSEGEKLGPNEKIVYIGKGIFAVIEYKDKYSTTFSIKRRIPWEKEGEKYTWRKDIQQRNGL